MPHHDDTKVAAVLHDYRTTNMKVTEIAAKHGVSLPTVSAWVKRAHLRLRGKGRRKKTEPAALDMRVLKLVDVLTYEQAAARLKTSKQNIGRIVKRWKAWRKPQVPPYVVGDVVLWKTRKLCVMEAGIETGLLRDARGNYVREFPWVVNGRDAVTKVGHNPDFGKTG